MGGNDRLSVRRDQLLEQREERAGGMATAAPRARRSRSALTRRSPRARKLSPCERASKPSPYRRRSCPSSWRNGVQGEVVGGPGRCPCRPRRRRRAPPRAPSESSRGVLGKAEEVLGAQVEAAMRPVAEVRVSARDRRRTPSSVGTSVASVEPAVIARAAIAIASRTVDLPDPLPPTNSVTGASNRSGAASGRSGDSNGNPVSGRPVARCASRRWTTRRVCRSEGRCWSARAAATPATEDELSSSATRRESARRTTSSAGSPGWGLAQTKLKRRSRRRAASTAGRPRGRARPTDRRDLVGLVKMTPTG